MCESAGLDMPVGPLQLLWSSACIQECLRKSVLRDSALTMTHMLLQGYTPNDTYMDLALKSMQELMKQHIIGNPKDRMAVVFYAAVSLCQTCTLLCMCRWTFETL